jgi:hypothetical protein
MLESDRGSELGGLELAEALAEARAVDTAAGPVSCIAAKASATVRRPRMPSGVLAALDGGDMGSLAAMVSWPPSSEPYGAVGTPPVAAAGGNCANHPRVT